MTLEEENAHLRKINKKLLAVLKPWGVIPAGYQNCYNTHPIYHINLGQMKLIAAVVAEAEKVVSY